jgi:hypothetical protein
MSPISSIVHAIIDQHISYLAEEALQDLFEGVAECDRRALEGSIIEAGCALGGSAIVMATAKSPSRPFWIYDVFGMIPAPSEKDGDDVHQRYETIKSGRSKGLGDQKYYGYEDDLYHKVVSNFERNGIAIEQNEIRLVPGLFEETMTIDGPVAFAHIDGDWFNSVMTCLTRIAPRLVSGGVLVIDDYDHWSGCRRAVDEYFADKRDRFSFSRKSRLHIQRV